MILTNKKIYSAQKKEIKPICGVCEIQAFTYCKNLKDKHYIIHVSQAQDEVYYGENIGEVLDAIKYVYFAHFGRNLPVYELPENDQVEKYAKSFKDVAKQKTLMPDTKFLNKKHDIYVKG